ncbi:hypothetical protein OPV22_031107 [Ensete ventricosum]|uniref:Secreted protein n=1 Tax=Ensete ventricosum TaxID=4639 RepID=A0AAV8P0Y6_ENSVE|nr:hypothetical protein OPV22_031107 [Ensete ventricosum]
MMRCNTAHMATVVSVLLGEISLYVSELRGTVPGHRRQLQVLLVDGFCSGTLMISVSHLLEEGPLRMASFV